MGVWVCAAGLGAACSQLDRCGRREKFLEAACPELLPWPGSSALCRNVSAWGLERRPRTSSYPIPSFLGQGVKGEPTHSITDGGFYSSESQPS